MGFCEMRRTSITEVMVVIVAFIMLLSAISVPTVSGEKLRTLSYTVEFGVPEIEKIGNYDVIRLESCGYIMKVGEPALPVKQVLVLLPPDGKVENVSVVVLDSEKLPGDYYIYPAQPPVWNITVYEPVPPNSTIYNSSTPYPGVLYEYVGIRILRGYKIAAIKLYPFQYVPLSGEVTFYKKVKVTLTLSQVAGEPVSPVPEINEWVRTHVINPEMMHEYETIHGSIDYLIVTTELFADEVQLLKEWKEGRGLRVAVETMEDIIATYSGCDVPEQVRNCIIHYYKNEHVRYVLLVGDVDDAENPYDSDMPPTYSYDEPWEVPTRYVWNPRDLDKNGDWDTFFTPTDYYYAGLDGSWDADGDGYFGENATRSASGVDEVDWTPEVWVGRLPARTEEEVTNMVNKTIRFEQTHLVVRDMLLLGAQLDNLTYGSTCKEHLVEEGIIPAYVDVHRYYEESGALSWENVRDAINTYDPALVDSASHGSESGDALLIYRDGTFADTSTPDYVTNTGILWYAQACSSGAFDWHYDCLGEAMEKDPDGSTVNYIGGTRETWYYVGERYLSGLNGLLDVLFWEQFFAQGYMQPGPCLYLSKLTYVTRVEDINWEIERQNLLAYNLIGDPETPFGPVMVEVVVHLYPGWNLVSLPIIPKDKRIEYVFGPIMGKWSEIWTYDAQYKSWVWAREVYSGGVWTVVGTLRTLEDGKGYWICMTEEAYLVVRGYGLVPGPNVPPTYPVYKGWNLIGLKSKYETPVADYLRDLNYSYIIGFDPSTGRFISVDPSTGTLTPGMGYWVYFNEDGIIIPPTQ